MFIKESLYVASTSPTNPPFSPAQGSATPRIFVFGRVSSVFLKICRLRCDLEAQWLRIIPFLFKIGSSISFGERVMVNDQHGKQDLICSGKRWSAF